MSSQPLQILLAGQLQLHMLTTLPEERNRFEDPECLEADDGLQYAGGTVGGVGLLLTQLGEQPQLRARLGDDLFGRGLLDLMSDARPTLISQLRIDSEAHTSYAMLIESAGGQVQTVYYPGASDTFLADDVTDAALDGVGILHFGSPGCMKSMSAQMGMETRSLLERVKARGVTTSMVMELPDQQAESGEQNWMMLLGMVLPYVDLFITDFDDAMRMLEPDVVADLAPGESIPFDDEWLDQLAVSILNMGSAVVVFRLPGNAVYVRTSTVTPRIESMGACSPQDVERWRARELFSGAFHVEGTCYEFGARYGLQAGLLNAMIKGMSPEDCINAAAGACACGSQSPGGAATMPLWDDLELKIAGGWARSTAEIALDGWTQDEEHRLHLGPREKTEV